ncbi:MAG: class D sortase [Oscillospiraceae bacterium]|nr:class D sortase [Oscillospiraceae bacterium]
MISKKRTHHHRATPKFVLILTPVFILLICCALIILLNIPVYNKTQTYINVIFSDKLKSNTTASQSISVDKNIKTYEDTQADVAQNGEIIRPKFGDQYGMISCDAINLYVPLYWGSSDTLLKNGACQSTASFVLGEKGNVVISAHVNTFFADLNKLKENDMITINTSYGKFTYKVTEQVTFEKTNKKYVTPSEEDKLTLYTCVPHILGPSDERLAVICEPVEKLFSNQ